jgi:hypothetical protein
MNDGTRATSHWRNKTERKSTFFVDAYSASRPKRRLPLGFIPMAADDWQKLLPRERPREKRDTFVFHYAGNEGC